MNALEKKKNRDKKAYNRSVKALGALSQGARITVGCNTCKEKTVLIAATALNGWLPKHVEHDTWIRE